MNRNQASKTATENFIHLKDLEDCVEAPSDGKMTADQINLYTSEIKLWSAEMWNAYGDDAKTLLACRKVMSAAIQCLARMGGDPISATSCPHCGAENEYIEHCTCIGCGEYVFKPKT